MDQDLKGGKLTAGSLVVPGLNLSTAFLPVPIAKSGEWKGTPISAATTTMSPVQSNVYATPMAFPSAPTLQSIGIDVTVAAGGTPGTFSRIELLIFNDDGTGNLNPSSVLLDAGSVSVLTTGFKTIAISQAIPAAGTYWLAAVWQTDYTSPTAPTVVAIANSLIDLPTNSATPYNVRVTGYGQSGVTGTPGAWAGTRGGITTCPRVQVQNA